jgi:hypothetical protein
MGRIFAPVYAPRGFDYPTPPATLLFFFYFLFHNTAFLSALIITMGIRLF